jgi:tetratricopeptide (TPR) repeat protein
MNAGLVAFSEGRFDDAERNLSAALSIGGISPDQVVDLYVHRAVCRANLGDTKNAHADLDAAEQGAPNLDLVLSARASVLEREGNSAAARKMLAKARTLNPQVKIFRVATQE